jgi:hypothetical protein
MTLVGTGDAEAAGDCSCEVYKWPKDEIRGWTTLNGMEETRPPGLRTIEEVEEPTKEGSVEGVVSVVDMVMGEVADKIVEYAMGLSSICFGGCGWCALSELLIMLLTWVSAKGFCIMFGCTENFCPVEAPNAIEDGVTVLDGVSCRGKLIGALTGD